MHFLLIPLKIHGKKIRKTPTLLPGVVTWCSGCKEVLWIVMNRACALVSLWLFSTVSRQNDVKLISWMNNVFVNVYPHCLRVFERIHCFCSKGANVEKTIRHVQATFWLHCDSCSAHDIWKVSGKKLNHHCICIYIRIDQWQSNRINTMEQKQVDMRQVCCDINQPKKEWHRGECNLGCYSGLWFTICIQSWTR